MKTGFLFVLMTLKAIIRFNVRPFAEGEKFTEHFEM